MASSYLRTLWRPTLFHRPAPSSGATKLPPAASRTGRRVAVSLTAALASGLALILAARPLAAQGQSELQQPTFRISVDRIEIGAVVTDSKGHHITNLRIEEFTLLDGGKLQQLTHCEYVRSPTPTALPSASPWKAASELPTVIPPHCLANRSTAPSCTLSTTNLSHQKWFPPYEEQSKAQLNRTSTREIWWP